MIVTISANVTIVLCGSLNVEVLCDPLDPTQPDPEHVCLAAEHEPHIALGAELDYRKPLSL
jgi:hypothetical protein